MRYHLWVRATGLFFCVAMNHSVTSFAADPTLNFGGRIMLDYTSADIENPDNTIEDGELRRAHLSIFGNLSDTLKYKAEINKATGSPVLFQDAYIQFSPKNSKSYVKVGQVKTTNSLDELTSSRFTSTLERAAFTDAVGFNRRVGIQAGTSGDNFTLAAGAFSSNLRSGGDTKDGYAFSARGTYNPVNTDDLLVHLGASWRYRAKGKASSNLRYRQRPYTHVAPSRIINTGRFARSDTFIGAEAAVISGPFWASGEYAFISASGNGANPDGDFGGFYGEAGVFFGGKKTYKDGKFSRPAVDVPINKGGMGALALVARYDQIDLQNSIYTGKQDTKILGADWYPVKHVRLGVNYFNTDAENGSADKASGFLARLQYDF